MEEINYITPEFMASLGEVATLNDYELINTRQLEDGYVEAVFLATDEAPLHEDKWEAPEFAIDFRVAPGLFHDRVMLEVRTFDQPKDGSTPPKARTFYISPIPYVLWGAVFCEP